MISDLNGTGVTKQSLEDFVDGEVMTLPGLENRGNRLSVFLTGSRSVGMHSDQSDIDLEVVCGQHIFDDVRKACLEAGVITSKFGFFVKLEPSRAAEYFGERNGGVHFSITPTERLEKKLSEYNDITMWIWQNARMVADPGMQVERVVEAYREYPEDVLVRKIKYHWLKAGYWLVDVYPHHHKAGSDVLAAMTALANGMHEYLRVFNLVEKRPYPYPEKLMKVSGSTNLGRKFCGFFKQLGLDLVSGGRDEDEIWERLDGVFRRLCCCDLSKEAMKLWQQCQFGMIGAGVDRDWVEADYENINELLSGELVELSL